MDNMENMDFEAMRDKQADELMQLLDERRMKELQLRLEDMNEFDVAEFLSEIGDNRMPMVFRLLSKQMAADVFANFDSPEQEQILYGQNALELSVGRGDKAGVDSLLILAYPAYARNRFAHVHVFFEIHKLGRHYAACRVFGVI